MKNNVFKIVYRPTAMRLLSLCSEAPNVTATNNFFALPVRKCKHIITTIIIVIIIIMLDI